MKGVVVLALKELVQTKFGTDKWTSALKKSGVDREPMIVMVSNIDDQVVMKVLQSLCEVLNLSITQLADAFGDYWVNVYSQRYYSNYYKDAKNAREFLLKLDSVHVASTKNIADSTPPRFEYEWKDDKTLYMKYKSHRRLIDIMVGLIKGVGKHYNEELKVTKSGESLIKIVFP